MGHKLAHTVPDVHTALDGDRGKYSVWGVEEPSYIAGRCDRSLVQHGKKAASLFAGHSLSVCLSSYRERFIFQKKNDSYIPWRLVSVPDEWSDGERLLTGLVEGLMIPSRVAGRGGGSSGI